jgi:hypothetical protein
MNRRRLIPLVACCAAAVSLRAAAQATPPAITAADIARFQQQMETGCVARGLERKAPEDDVRHFCSCMVVTLQRTMPPADWQLAMQVAANHDDDGFKALVQQHFDELLACKANQG